MPSEVIDRAFEPFHTTKPKSSGTGLGPTTAPDSDTPPTETMPRMMGNEVAAHLGRLRPDIPVLYMSGYAHRAT